MRLSRRALVGIAGAAIFALPALAAPRLLKLLIIGGTGFTGPQQVGYALARGHHVTVLNRNRSHPGGLPETVEQLVGDLNADVGILKGRKFDAVIDNPTTFPAWVRNAAQYLKDNIGHYIFISTVSVYRENNQPNADESAATTPMPKDLDPYTLVGEHRTAHYAELKSFAEAEVARHYQDRHTIIRPGLIVGPLDQSDRFTYWPVRIARGGEVLAPGAPSDPVQFIDARDLAEWTVRMAEMRAFGVYNATGPAKPFTMGEMLAGIRAVANPDAHFTWVPADFLEGQKVEPWAHMPVWVPPVGDDAAFARRNISRALAKNLTFRAFAATVSDTLSWVKSLPPDQRERIVTAERAGLPATREAAVLAAWHNR